MEKHAGYKRLLKWSLAQTDGTDPSAHKEVSKEDEEFLRKAMEEMVVDEVEVLKKYLVILQEPTAEDNEDEETEIEDGRITLKMKLQLLENTATICENIDRGFDLHLIGGYPIIINFLKSSTIEDNKIKMAAASVMAACTQNNPKAQEAAFECEIMPHIVEGLTNADPALRYKYVLCVSCMIRGYDEGLVEFERISGFDKLRNILDNNSSTLRIRRKVIFLLRSLLDTDRIRDIVRDLDMISTIVSYMEHEDVTISENAMECVSLLCTNNRENIEAVQKFDTVVETLGNKLMELESLPEEERQYTNEFMVRIKVLLKRLNPGNQ